MKMLGNRIIVNSFKSGIVFLLSGFMLLSFDALMEEMIAFYIFLFAGLLATAFAFKYVPYNTKYIFILSIMSCIFGTSTYMVAKHDHNNDYLLFAVGIMLATSLISLLGCIIFIPVRDHEI